ncbi:hypothetical protein [Dyadobacter sandarakinus]|uniref:Uncharacterized protein n=1 Tax=Dyadobacter sandarakinus TaxID=2747268 RepID=A0ABX7I499_9BACT|nr:hypothetical protein [Dyadobacter sandarakinus]QRR00683.1 hypothetical protein HWI92_07070 [Dyadobacter sandarakinus]
MKFILTIIIVFVYCSHSFGQQAALMYDSQHAVTKDSIGVIKRIASHPLSRNLKVVYTNGKKRKVPEKEVWGFRGRTGHLYRVYKGDVFRVMPKKDFVRYERHLTGTHYQVRFSSDLDSPMVWSKRKARKYGSQLN